MTADPTGAAAGAADVAPAVALAGITKRYPGVVANDGIDLTVAARTIHGLLGENGAGKSTLMKILYGLTRPDSGSVTVAGVERRFASPADAIAAGIGMVQQHFSLVDTFTVAENIVLGDEPRRGPWWDRNRTRTIAADLIERFGFRLDPDAVVGDLAVGARQRVEILKALHRGADVLILDEPTATLAPQEAEELFGVLHGLRAGGTTVVFISHRLPEVLHLCDAVTVLRDGRVVGRHTIGDHERAPGPARDAAFTELSRMMVGRDLPEPPARGRPTDRPVLQLEGVSDGERLGPLDLVVRAGEIVGIAGVEGNGQTELVELLVGVRPCRSGRVVVAGRDLTAEPVGERLAHGIAHIAEDRHGAGVALGASLVENAILGYDGRAPLARRGWLSRKRSLHFTRDLVGRFDVRTASLAQSMATLSGGNQQKLVVGRELSRLPQLLIAAQPTRGLDIGATAFVHDQLAALRAGGAAVLLVSLDLAEVVAVSDRIVVLYGGRIAGEVRSAEADIDRLGAWMTGGAGAPAEAPAGVGA